MVNISRKDITLKADYLNNRGYFWWSDEILPQGCFAPATAVSGVLQINSAGLIRLSLDATLPRKSGATSYSALSEENLSELRINGILIGDSRSIQLLGLTSAGFTMRIPGISVESIVAHRCLVSTKSDFSQSEIKLKSLNFSLVGYEEWLDLRTIKVSARPRSLTATYLRPRKHEWNVSFGRIVLDFDLPHPMSGYRSELSLEEKANLTLFFRKEIEIEQGIELTRRVEDLLILLTDSDLGLEFPTSKSRKQKAPIDIYYPRLERSSDQVSWSRCCVLFPHIADVFGEIFEKWLDKHKIYGPGFHLYLGQRRRTHMYSEHRFASLVWGLESLHRRLVKEQVDDALNTKIERIFSQISKPKDRKWVEGRLKSAGEPNLASRLSSIFGELPFDFLTNELNVFSERCAKRRNDISHFGGMREVGKYNDFLEDIRELNEALDVLYQARLLQEIGVPEQRLRHWFTKSHNSSAIQKCLAVVGINLPTSV